MAIWCGERASKFYAFGMGETRSSANLLLQAKLCMNAELHLQVVRRMYERRFPKLPNQELTLKQIRGMEGIRVKQAYKQASKATGVNWSGRNYKQDNWNNADDINRALSMANSYLYGVCHAAIVALGYSPGLGFVHTGKMLSFIYDVADLYKAETTIPTAFESVARKPVDLDRDIRITCRRYFKNTNILKKIPEDIEWIFSVHMNDQDVNAIEPCQLWDEEESIAGGVNFSKDLE